MIHQKFLPGTKFMLMGGQLGTWGLLDQRSENIKIMFSQLFGKPDWFIINLLAN